MCTERLPAGQSTQHADVLRKSPKRGGDPLTLALMGRRWKWLLSTRAVPSERKGESLREQPKADRAKRYWVAPRPRVISACLPLSSVFLEPPLPSLSLQRRRGRDLRPVRRRQRRSLHGEGRDPAGQADPERRGLPAPEQRGAPGPEGERAERPAPPRVAAEGVPSSLSSLSSFMESQLLQLCPDLPPTRIPAQAFSFFHCEPGGECSSRAVFSSYSVV